MCTAQNPQYPQMGLRSSCLLLSNHGDSFESFLCACWPMRLTSQEEVCTNPSKSKFSNLHRPSYRHVSRMVCFGKISHTLSSELAKWGFSNFCDTVAHNTEIITCPCQDPICPCIEARACLLIGYTESSSETVSWSPFNSSLLP